MTRIVVRDDTDENMGQDVQVRDGFGATRPGTRMVPCWLLWRLYKPKYETKPIQYMSCLLFPLSCQSFSMIADRGHVVTGVCSSSFKFMNRYSISVTKLIQDWTVEPQHSLKNEPPHDKTSKTTVHPEKTQINLSICPV